MKKIVLLVFILISSHTFAQECGTDKYIEYLKKQYPEKFKKSQENFQNFQKRNKISIPSSPIRIPVVFHIIHNGEPVGTGSNLSQFKIQEQLGILNSTFNNPNTSNEAGFGKPTNPMFQFCLAKTDPFGRDTNGITRRFGPDYYEIDNTYSQDFNIKQISWNKNVYLNVWITDLRPDYDVSNTTAEGAYSSIAEISANSVKDGIVINHRYFGNNPYNNGATLTHEIGHWLGLKHIFSTSNCQIEQYLHQCDDNGDKVCDTPPTDESARDVSINSAGLRYSCSNGYISPRNFMDYYHTRTFFTKLQAEKMHEVTSFFRLSMYNNDNLDADCSFKETFPGGGGNSTNTGPEPGANIEYSDYFNTLVPSVNFGRSVRLNNNWLVVTEPANQYLHIFKPTECNFVPFQSIRLQGGTDIGRDLLLNDDEIIVAGKNKVSIYKFDGDIWSFDYSISRNLSNRDFGSGIFKKGDYLFIQEKLLTGSGAIYVYKKNSSGKYIHHQNISNTGTGAILPSYSSRVANYRNGFIFIMKPSSLPLVTKMVILKLQENGKWELGKTVPHSELSSNSYAISTTFNNIYVSYRSGDRSYINTYNIDSYEEYTNNNNPNLIYSFNTSSIFIGQPSYINKPPTIKISRDNERNLKAINDNLLIGSYYHGSPSFIGKFTVLYEKTGGDWTIKYGKDINNNTTAINEFRTMPKGSSNYNPEDSFSDSSIDLFGEYLTIGTGISDVYVYKLSELYDSYPQYSSNICNINSNSIINGSDIILGGNQCNPIFDNSTMQILASNSITLKPGTQVKKGSSVSFKIGEDNICTDTFASVFANNGKSIGSIVTKSTPLESFPKTNEAIYLYPNPTKNSIIVEIRDDSINISSYMIHSMFNPVNSTTVTKNKSNKLNIDLSQFKTGLYNLRLVTDKGRIINKKIIKE